MSFNQWHTPTPTGSHVPSHVPSMQANFPKDIMYSHILQSLNEMHETQAVINSRLTNLETTASPLSDLEDTLTTANNGQVQLRQDASAPDRGHGHGQGQGQGQAATRWAMS